MRASPHVLVLVAALFGPPAPAQIQVQEVVAWDAMQGALFGFASALEGATAVIGAQTDNASGQIVGAAYVFELGPQGWQQTQKLLPAQPFFGMRFGTSVGFSGDWLAVGADGENSSTGAVYIFRRQGGQFVQHQKLTAIDPGPSSLFGQCLAMREGRLIVGAPQKSTTYFGDGAAYVYELVGTTWTAVTKLTAPDPQEAAIFGTSVAIHGDFALVGSPFTDAAQQIDIGAGYVFERLASGWSFKQRLVPLQGHFNQRSGFAVAIGSQHLFLGAHRHNASYTSQGAIYRYELSGSFWIEMQILYVSDPEQGQNLPMALALDGDRLLAATPNDDDHGSNTGSAYIFEKAGGNWIQTQKLLPSNPSVDNLLASSVALHGDTALLGSKGTDGACPSNWTCNSGSAYFFRLGMDSVQYCSCPASSAPCANADDHGGCRSSTGHGAVLSAAGTGSAQADDLELVCQWMPPSTPALFFMGGAAAQSPFGDGRMCVSGAGAMSRQRFLSAVSNSSGVVSFGPAMGAYATANFPRSSQLQPGSTWNFQVWYRDAVGPCGSGQNLSNAVSVTFRP